MIVFMGLAVVCALGGGWLLFDFFLWFFTGEVVSSVIEAFEVGKPVLSYETVEGKKMRARAERVTHMGYFLGRAQVGDVFNAIYRKENPELVRVHGYLYPVAGILLLMPLVAYLASAFSRVWMATQVSFVFTFLLVILGGWVIMKLLRANY